MQERRAEVTRAAARVRDTKAALEEQRRTIVDAEAALVRAKERAEATYTAAIEKATAKRAAALAKATQARSDTLEEAAAELARLSAELLVHEETLAGFGDVSLLEEEGAGADAPGAVGAAASSSAGGGPAARGGSSHAEAAAAAGEGSAQHSGDVVDLTGDD